MFLIFYLLHRSPTTLNIQADVCSCYISSDQLPYLWVVAWRHPVYLFINGHSQREFKGLPCTVPEQNGLDPNADAPSALFGY